MKIIFFGSSHFGLPCLSALKEAGLDVVCCVTQPDKKKGRGLHVDSTDIKKAALKFGIPVFQPANINSNDSVKALSGYDPDIFIVIAYGQKLSDEVLSIPQVFAINVHASLLPRYRGAAPINWAIINGEKKTGLSVIKLTQKMDAGPVILKRQLDIGEHDTALDLEERLSKLAPELLLESLNLIKEGKYKLNPQSDKDSLYAHKLKKSDGLINWKKTAVEVYDLIRGCSIWPGAFTYYKGKLLKVHKASPAADHECKKGAACGEIIKVSKSRITICCGKGFLDIEELQPEGKKAMSAAAFITGHCVCVGDILGKK